MNFKDRLQAINGSSSESPQMGPTTFWSGGDAASRSQAIAEMRDLIHHIAGGDRLNALALEALVMSAGPDGTARLSDIASRYRASMLAVFRRAGQEVERELKLSIMEEVCEHLASYVFPRLAEIGLVALPDDPAGSPESVIRIADARLRPKGASAPQRVTTSSSAAPAMVDLTAFYPELARGEPEVRSSTREIERTVRKSIVRRADRAIERLTQPRTAAAPSAPVAVPVVVPVAVSAVVPVAAPERAQSTEIDRARPAIAAKPTAAAETAWAHLWYSVQRHTWSTLVLIPADDTLRDVVGSLEPARALADTGRLHSPHDVDLIDATHIDPRSVTQVSLLAESRCAEGAQVIIALDSPVTNPAAIAIARRADAAILVVPLGGARLDVARRAVEAIGRDRFIGSVAVRGGR